MQVPRGALVAQVIDGSPAQKGDIQVGDVILYFNGQAIFQSSDLPPLVGLSSVGKKASVVLMRSGKERTIELVIESLPDEDELVARRSKAGSASGDAENDGGPEPLMGVTLSALDDQTRQALNIKYGVLVKALRTGPFAQAGVRAGDVIAMVNGKPVKSVEALRSMLKSLPVGQSVPMLVYRKDGPVFLPLKLND